MIYVYGGFGKIFHPGLSKSELVFMDHFPAIFAFPGIRGGGDKGEKWHKAGTREDRQNGFDDLIAAAEFLHAQGLTDPDHTLISGGSNGGTVVSAVAN